MSVPVSLDPVLAVLKGARELLTPEGAWIQTDYAQSAKGRSVHPDSPRAVRWCLIGACRRFEFRKHLLINWIGAVNPFLPTEFFDRPSVWNDVPGRTQAEVLDLLDRTIALRESAS